MSGLNSSFRDPEGFVYRKGGVLYRQINESGKENYQFLKDSGLYDALSSQNLLVEHEEVDLEFRADDRAWRIIMPKQIPYISYPYEWCFEQYRDAAILTLDVLLKALEHQMILKDASAYNIQFRGATPVFIDTLSFKKYQEGQVWDGYGQFCKHFLAPVLLMSAKNPQMAKLMRNYIDGIPLNLAVDILGGKWKWKMSVHMHLYMHAKMQQDTNATEKKAEHKAMPMASLKVIINSLRSLILWAKPPAQETEWGVYYEKMLNYSDDAFEAKRILVEQFLQQCSATMVCDMGSNRGEFSRLGALRPECYVIAADIDHTAVNQHHQYNKAHNIKNILPLVMDLTNPSPSIGWESNERDSFVERGSFDCVMALALIHHLAISNNLPFDMIAHFFAAMGQYLIIEFVPKEDSQVQKLLLNREDIFKEYDEKYFEQAFSIYYKLILKESILNSHRTLYLFQRNSTND